MQNALAQTSISLTNAKKLALWLLADVVFVALVFSWPDLPHPPLDKFLIGHFLGIAIATVVMYTGMGGGVLWFPAFVWFGCNPTEAVALSLFTQIAGKGSGTFKYWRSDLIDKKVALRFMPSALIGILIGFLLSLVVPEQFERWLLLFFSSTVFYLFWVMLRSLITHSDHIGGRLDEAHLAQSWPVVLTSSTFTGMLSIGNSAWLIPYMEQKLRMQISRAVATSVAVMFYLAIFFLLINLVSIKLGLAQWPALLPLLWATCSGVIIGGQIGAGLVDFDWLKKHQKLVFVIALFLSASHMLWKFFSY